MIQIAVVEDDDTDAKNLTELIERAFAEMNERCEIVRYGDAVTFLDGYKAKYDIVFMDIELPDLDGMESAKKLRALDGDVILIFVTNMAQFAVKGYEVDAMDFMVKPVAYENLQLKIARAWKRLESRKGEKLVIQGKNGACVLSVPQIKYIEVLNHKLTFYTTEGAVTASGSLSKLEEKLKKFDFSRCNNCYLVNLDYVTDVVEYTAFVGGDRLTVSRSRKKPFLKDIADHLGGSV